APRGTREGEARPASSRRDVGLREVVALEQQRYAERPRAGIGKAVAHVEPRRMPPPAISLERPDRTAPDLGGDRDDQRPAIYDEIANRLFSVGNGNTELAREA